MISQIKMIVSRHYRASISTPRPARRNLILRWVVILTCFGTLTLYFTADATQLARGWQKQPWISGSGIHSVGSSLRKQAPSISNAPQKKFAADFIPMPGAIENAGFYT